MNTVSLVGRIGNELEPKEGRTPYVKFRLAVDRPIRAGEEKQTDWINIIAFGKQAETLCKYQKKGNMLAVSGRIQTGSYTNRNGEKVFTTDVIADRFDFLTWDKQEEKHIGKQEEFADFAALDEEVPF